MSEAQPDEPEIHHAARLGNIDELRHLLEAGADANARFDLTVNGSDYFRGLTPLMIAAGSTDGATTDTLRFLVENGADPFLPADWGATAAWFAAGAGLAGSWRYDRSRITPDHADRLRFLLDCGLDARESSSNGQTLLTEAAEIGDPTRVKLLLDRGAVSHAVRASELSSQSASKGDAIAEDAADDLEAEDSAPRYSFEVPLACAAESGSETCVQLLLDAGADPNEATSDGDIPLMHATSAAVVRALVKAGARIDATNSHHDVLGCILADEFSREVRAEERFETAAALLEAGAPLERIEMDEWTRLYTAAFRREANAVDFLLAHRLRNANDEPDPIARSWNEGTPLHAICWQGEGSDDDNVACQRIIKTLVAAGVPIEARDKKGRTALHKAIGGDWGNVAAVRELLNLGADVNALDNAMQSPLHLAARKGELECAQLLLPNAADPSLTHAEGQTPAALAAVNLQNWKWNVENSQIIGPDLASNALREAEELYTVISLAAQRWPN